MDYPELQKEKKELPLTLTNDQEEKTSSVAILEKVIESEKTTYSNKYYRCKQHFQTVSINNLHYAASLAVRGFFLNPKESLDILKEWNGKNYLTSSTKDLENIIDEIKLSGLYEFGELLLPDLNNRQNWTDSEINDLLISILDEKFKLLITSGVIHVLEIKTNNVVSFVRDESFLKRYLANHLSTKLKIPGNEKLLKRGIDAWKSLGTALYKEPKQFTFDDDPSLAFVKFSWRPTKGEYPAWNEFLSRCGDEGKQSREFMAWIGALIDPINTSRQCLWLRGDGQDGKSVVINSFIELFEGAAIALSDNIVSGSAKRFLNGALLGKRFVAYPECLLQKFPKSSAFRGLCGTDMVTVERKGQDSYSTKLKTKLMIASNPHPDFSSDRGDTSRMILIEVQPSNTRDDNTWGTKLKQELPYFIYDCLEAYKELAPNGGDIRISENTKDLLDDAAVHIEVGYEHHFEQCLALDPEGKVYVKELYVALKNTGFPTDSNVQMGEFRHWLKRRFGVERMGKNNNRYYKGIVLNKVMEILK